MREIDAQYRYKSSFKSEKSSNKMPLLFNNGFDVNENIKQCVKSIRRMALSYYNTPSRCLSFISKFILQHKHEIVYVASDLYLHRGKRISTCSLKLFINFILL